MRHKDKQIKSIKDLINALVKTVPQGEMIWFRGQADKTWLLNPSLSRLNKSIDTELALIKRFKQNAIPLAKMKPMSEWEWLFLMQHYGLPTRLLDWTESPLVGLYFAVENTSNIEDGALWCLSPTKFNINANITELPYDIPFFGNDDVLENYLPQKIAAERVTELNPIAGIAMRENPRVFAQMGAFTITHRNQISVESVGDKRHIWRFIIPSDFKEIIRKELLHLRITRLNLFPKLDNVALLAKEILENE